MATLKLFNAYSKRRINADNATFSLTKRLIFRTLSSALFQMAMIVNIRHIMNGRTRTTFFITA